MKIGLPAKWPASRNVASVASPAPTITELGAALAAYSAGRISSTEVYAKLTGRDQLWWRCCREAVHAKPFWLLGDDHEEAFQLITDGELRDSLGVVSDVAVAADLVCLVLAAPASASTQAQAAEAAKCWNGNLAVITPGVAGFDLDTAVASAVPNLRERLKQVIADLPDVTTNTEQAMVAICALLLAAEKPDSGRVVSIPVVFAQPGKSSSGVTGVLELREFAPGPPGLFPDPRGMRKRRVNRDFTDALKLAWQFATGPSGGSKCVLWRLWLDGGVQDDPIDGGSLGAAFAVGLRALLRVPRGPHPNFLARQRAYFTGLRRRRAITGVLAVERPHEYENPPLSARGLWLAEVGDMTAKLDAAKAGKLRLIAPAANESKGEENVDWAYTVFEADRYARQVRSRPFVYAAAAIVAVAGLAKLGLVLSASESQTTQQRYLAVSGTLIGESQAKATSNPDLARLEAVAAWHLAPTPAAKYAMLQAATLPPVAILDNTGKANEEPSFSADGKFLVDSFNDGDVKVWNTATDQVTATLTGVPSSSGVEFTSDDSLVATPGAEVEFWSLSTHHMTSAIKTDGPVEYMTFSPNGHFLATVPNNGAVQVWDARTHRLIKTIKQSSPGDINSMSFSPNGALLAIDTQDGVQLWDVRTGALSAAIPGQVDGMTFSPNSAQLAISTQDGVQLWDLAANSLLTTLNSGAGDPVTAVVFSPDGRELAVGTANYQVQVWNLTSHQLMTTINPGKVDAGPLLFSPDDSQLTIDSNSADIEVWDLARHQLVNEVSSKDSLALTPDVTLAATVTLTGTLELVNVAAQAELNYPAATLPSADPDDVSSIAFSPNGRLLAAGTRATGNASLGPKGISHGIRVWNVATHDLVATLEAPNNDDPILSVAFSPDSSLLAAGTYDGGTQVWNVATHQLVATLGSGEVVATVAFSGDGLLAAGLHGGGTQLWNLKTGKLVATLAHGPDNVSSLAFSPSGSLLAAGMNGADGLNMGVGHRGDGIQVWNTSTHKLVTTKTVGNSNQVTMVEFSRTGSLLANTSSGIEVWNVSGQQPTLTIGSSATWVAFSQDGTVAAIPTASGIQLWDTATGQEAATIPDKDTDSGTLPVAFTQDDKSLAAGANDGAVELWNIPYVANAPGYLCSVATEPFPRSVWTQYAPNIKYQQTCP